MLQMDPEQYQQLGGYSDEQGQHYAALYAATAQMTAAQQMSVAQMSAYDQAAHIAAWQVPIAPHTTVYLPLHSCLRGIENLACRRRVQQSLAAKRHHVHISSLLGGTLTVACGGVQQAAQANPTAYAQYAAYARQGMPEDAYQQVAPAEYQQEVQVRSQAAASWRVGVFVVWAYLYLISSHCDMHPFFCQFRRHGVLAALRGLRHFIDQRQRFCRLARRRCTRYHRSCSHRLRWRLARRQTRPLTLMRRQRRPCRPKCRHSGLTSRCLSIKPGLACIAAQQISSTMCRVAFCRVAS